MNFKAMVWGVCWLAASDPVAFAKEKAAQPWVEQKGVALLAERQADGDSFGMTVEGGKGKRLKRTYRLYGADCPESDGKDKFVAERIKEQAAYFGCKAEEIPELGKQAAAFTDQLLKNGHPKVFTRGKTGEKVQKVEGRPQRHYAMIEVTGPDGQRHWLHELLLQAGLARAHGTPAAWPPEAEDRHGEKEACKRFMKGLELMERKAKQAGLGAWRKAAR